VAVSNVELRVDGRNAVNQLNRVNRAANTLQGTVGKLAGAFAGIQAAKFVFFKTAELETQTRSLKVLTGSLGDAQKIIKELQQFGAVTPFTSAELIETAKRLKAFGFETEKIVDTTKRLGDIAGATGADLGGIATAFGQIQAKGRLQGEELLQLQERGVDLAGTLRKEYGLTGEEFQKALSKGQISAEAVSFALEKLTEKGGKYADGAISQSDTLAGKFSTLQDGIDNIARKIGEVLAPSLKSVLDLAIDAVNNINAAFAAGSITDTQKQGFKQLAEEEVKRFAGPLPGGPFGAGEIVVRTNGKTYKGAASSVVSQITNDLINAEIERLTQASAPKIPKSNIQTKIPALGAGTNGGAGSGGGRSGFGQTAEERAAEALKQQREQAAALLLSKKQEALLTGDITEQQRDQLQHVINKMNLSRQFPSLKEEELQVLRDQLDVNFGLTQADKDRIQAAKHLKEQQDAEAKRAEKLAQQYQGIADTLADGVVNALKGAVDGTTSLADAATNMLNDLTNQLLQVARNMLFFGNMTGSLTKGSGLLGSIFGGFMANGGTTKAGKSYVVGERGPELFTPGVTGTVTPNSALGGSNIVVNVDASGSNVQGDAQQGKALGQAIGAAVQAELIKQKRPGGLLS